MKSWQLWVRVMDGPMQLRSELIGEWTAPTHRLEDVVRIADSSFKHYFIIETVKRQVGASKEVS